MPRNRLPRVMKRYSQLADGTIPDLLRDFWTREPGTCQQVAQLHDRFMMLKQINLSLTYFFSLLWFT